MAMCITLSLYFTADLGVSTYDAVALIMADKKVAGFRACRVGTDVFCVAVGVLLHASIGIGTVVTALCIGPLIAVFNVCIARPLLHRTK